MNYYFLSLILLNILFLVISSATSKKKYGTTICASTFYWFSWVSVEIACLICDEYEWTVKPISDIAINYIFVAHLGAFMGFLLCDLTSKFKENVTSDKLIDNCNYLIHRFSKPVYLLTLIFGLLILRERISIIGFNLNFLTKAREIFNLNEFNILIWFGTHFSIIISIFMILYGLIDSKTGFDIKRIIYPTLIAAPLNIASGTRTFLVAYLLPYGVSYLLAKSKLHNAAHSPKRNLLSSFAVIIFIFFIFSLLGQLRGNEGKADDFNPVALILGWPASTLTALESWLPAAIDSPSTMGTLSFEWPSRVLSKLNLINYDGYVKIVGDVANNFRLLDSDSSDVVPKSIIPDLIFDFGKNLLIFCMMILCYLLQYISVNYSKVNIFKHSIACVSIIAASLTIQQSIFSSSLSITLVWAYIFYKFGIPRKYN